MLREVERKPERIVVVLVQEHVDEQQSLELRARALKRLEELKRRDAERAADRRQSS